jgi:hypothetical protein
VQLKRHFYDNSGTYTQSNASNAVDAKADIPLIILNIMICLEAEIDAQLHSHSSSDSQYVYLTASGSYPNRLFELKKKSK